MKSFKINKFCDVPDILIFGILLISFWYFGDKIRYSSLSGVILYFFLKKKNKLKIIYNFHLAIISEIRNYSNFEPSNTLFILQFWSAFTCFSFNPKNCLMSQAWWHEPEFHSTWEAEAGLFEPRNLKQPGQHSEILCL